MNDEEKIRNHERTLAVSKPIVFCLKCGSTVVDQISRSELYCGTCHNRAYWSGQNFGIRRGIEEWRICDVEELIDRPPMR